MKFTTVRLLVKDFAASHDFYCRALGLKPKFGGPQGPYEEFETDAGVCIALFSHSAMMAAIDQPAAPAVGNRLLLSFEVNNVDMAADALKARGVLVVSPPKDQPEWAIRAAHFRDPDGNLIELNAPLKK